MTRLEKMQNIVANKQMEIVDGVPVDLQTANLFLIVYGRLQNENNKARLLTDDMRRTCKTIWALIK